MSSQNTLTKSSNTHPLPHIPGTSALIFSCCAPFTVYPNHIMKWHPTHLQAIIHYCVGEQSKGMQGIKHNALCFSKGKRDVKQSFAYGSTCSLYHRSSAAQGHLHDIHPTQPRSPCHLLTSAINTLLAIWNLSILSTCPNQLITLRSVLLANSISIQALLCSSSFLTLSICDTPTKS